MTYNTIYDTIYAGGEKMAGIEKIEAQKVLEYYGYRLDRQKGSHKQYINQKGDVITIKSENPLKAVYIKDILKRIGRI